ncbi:MAG: molybdopterin molybdotransferase MoeA [Akkermansiaceae bacterium]|jgi:molybdopterin molybdotransferase|tara:strand:+ start:7443 stop:8594 length:1152 start_codon:yes stop_codon:yes gene_type:complete
MSLITPQEAEELMLSNVDVLECETVRLENTLGRILREGLFADRPFPPFNRVTMDGIAFCFSDFSSQPLALQGIHAAGNPTPPSLKTGHCWQIMTGSEMPPDCDTVVPYEEVTLTEGSAIIECEPVAGKFIHREGSDASQGDLMIKPGTRIGPEHIGILASIGASQIKVTRRPRIKILSTGDELVPVEQTPLPHQLRQSNGITLLSAVQQWGPSEATWDHLADDLETTTTGIARALENSDLVILSGGISKGKKDYVRPALESLRGEPVFHGVAQRPGKPLAFWKGVVALPGNPNSTLTTFQRYVVPLLCRMIGAPDVETTTLPLAGPIQQHPFLTQFLPAKINSGGRAISLSPQNSGDFVTPLEGKGYLEIPPGESNVGSAKYF